jgi:hypothetical protein
MSKYTVGYIGIELKITTFRNAKFKNPRYNSYELFVRSDDIIYLIKSDEDSSLAEHAKLDIINITKPI